MKRALPLARLFIYFDPDLVEVALKAKWQQQPLPTTMAASAATGNAEQRGVDLNLEGKASSQEVLPCSLLWGNGKALISKYRRAVYEVRSHLRYRGSINAICSEMLRLRRKTATLNPGERKLLQPKGHAPSLRTPWMQSGSVNG